MMIDLVRIVGEKEVQLATLQEQMKGLEEYALWMAFYDAIMVPMRVRMAELIATGQWDQNQK